MARKIFINGVETVEKKKVKLYEIEDERDIYKLMRAAHERVRRSEPVTIPEEEKKKLKKDK